VNREPIKISRDDLVSENVEGRLREQATVRSTKDHYERANVVAPEIAAVAGWRAWLLKSFVYLACFGFLGGAGGAVIGNSLVLRPDRNEEAAALMADLRKIDRAEQVGRYIAADAERARARVREIGRRNAAFIAADHAEFKTAASSTSDREIAAAAAEDARIARRATLLAFAAAGLLIAAALASADRVIERDIRGALTDGAIAGVGGAAIGAGIAVLLPAIESALVGRGNDSSAARVLGHIAVFALFGAGVGAIPGLVERNGRRAGAGVVGGLVGGALGGLLVEPASRHLGGEPAAHVVAFALIGAFIGLTTGWFEDAAKQGWLRVASGLIAGKQFILYRNPTFVGSAPMSHIYLFRDPQVGRRHAAIFHVVGGYEIENLPLGGPTLVNGQPVSRVRLRRGDRIAIGRTTLVFDEKAGS
jgi:hypothetical protein